MIKIRTALLSVSDKVGIIEFAKGLRHLGIEILSSGGTAALLREKGVECQGIADYTGFPEILGGRVKTLHPKIHGGILARRGDTEHEKQMKEHGIQNIDLVVVNLYPFESLIKINGSLSQAIEQIDIGGVTLLRSAAKNFEHVVVASRPDHYSKILRELRENQGKMSEKTSRELAIAAFQRTAEYDRAIRDYLAKEFLAEKISQSLFPQKLSFDWIKAQDLRYGENPHQKGAWYRDPHPWGMAEATQHHGKELSFNNLIDLDSALALVSEFQEPCAAIIKHASPCGVAASEKLETAFQQAFEADPVSAYGGIVGLNQRLDEKTAQAISKAGFLECIIAPSYSSKALQILQQKKNVRILECPLVKPDQKRNFLDLKRISGGVLLQEWDLDPDDPKQWKVVTKKKPSPKQIRSLSFAWKIAKFTRSNAIVLAQGTRTVGIGAGQPSRVEAVRIAVKRAGESAKGTALASDAFFPMSDNVHVAARAGVGCIVQPGGSIRDEEVIAAADKAGIAMVFTGIRHFRH